MNNSTIIVLYYTIMYTWGYKKKEHFNFFNTNIISIWLLIWISNDFWLMKLGVCRQKFVSTETWKFYTIFDNLKYRYEEYQTVFDQKLIKNINTISNYIKTI